MRLLLFVQTKNQEIMKNSIFIFLFSLPLLCNCQNPEFTYESGFAEVNGTKLYYEVAGSGEPILFVHGNFGDHRHWDHQFETLSKKYKVIRYDVRGYGKSANPDPEEAYYDYEDIKSLLDFLKIEKVHICGLSMGSGIATDFALMYPDRCNSLIPIGPWPSGYGSGEIVNEGTNMLWTVFGDVVKTLNEKGIKEATDYWWTGTDFVKSSVRSEKTLKELLKMGYEYDFWGFKNPNKRSNPSPPAINRLNEINVPTLIVTAEYDMSPCITVADLMEKEMKNAKKISIKDAGHCMNMEKPEEFNAELVIFIESLK